MIRPAARTHVIDMIFPISLLAVFAVSALCVLLFAAGIYRSTVDSSDRSNTARTCLSYMVEKIHSGNSVKTGSLDGRDALIIGTEVDGTEYTTYIYTDQGRLKELFTAADTEVSPSAGTDLLPVKKLSMMQLGKNLYKLTCTDDEGNSSSAVVGSRSEN